MRKGNHGKRAQLRAVGTDARSRAGGTRYPLPMPDHVRLPRGYGPSPSETYMNRKQLAYFRRKLSDWRNRLVARSRNIVDSLCCQPWWDGDGADRAAREVDNILSLHARDRDRNLARKVDLALRRIGEGRHCEDTDEAR